MLTVSRASARSQSALRSPRSPRRLRAGRLLRLTLALGLAAVAIVAAWNAGGTSVAEAQTATTYTVRSGDTLSAVARQHGTTVNAIAGANNIANPNRISVGQVLRIPGAAAAPSPPRASPAPTPTAAPSRPAQTERYPGVRDPFLWPFSAESPWNHPLGSGASFGSASDPITRDLRADTDGIVLNVASWTIPVFRADGPTRGIYLRDGRRVGIIRVPESARPSPPLLPDHCSSDRAGEATDRLADAHLNLVTLDNVVELYAVRRMCNGNLEARYKPLVHDLRGNGIGLHSGHDSGSRAYGGSSIGGLVRQWELERGEIRHALAVALPPDRLRSGFVWPATSQDAAHAERYRGNVPMGTLAALPPDFDLDAISFASPYGRALARAMQDYGVYVVDSAGSGGMKFYAEPSVQELDGWEEMSNDLRELVPHLLPVLNNAPDRVGGGGVPRAPLAPRMQ